MTHKRPASPDAHASRCAVFRVDTAIHPMDSPELYFDQTATVVAMVVAIF